MLKVKDNLVSVIVPAYNEEKHIKQCLISIRNQTYKYIELIVIDDGSTDETRKISREFAHKFLMQKHIGPAIARNKGAKIAKGEILVFIDADMYLDKNYVKKIIRPIIDKKSFATFTKEEYVANPKNLWSKCFQIDINLPVNKSIKKGQGNYSERFRAITKKAFLETNGFLENRGYGEDEVLNKKNSIVAKGAICYHYNPDSLKDVFLSARWIGRSKLLSLNFTNVLRYSLINSMLISLKKIHRNAPPSFFLYKIVFDLGILSGILFKNPRNYYVK